VSVREEIGEQPDVVRRAFEENRALIGTIAAAIRERDCEFVLIAARGTSDHAAIYG